VDSVSGRSYLVLGSTPGSFEKDGTVLKNRVDWWSPWASTLLGISWLALAFPIAAEPASEPEAQTREQAPEEIVVIGHRGDKPWLEVPASVGIVEADAIQRAQQQLDLGESLMNVPGVFIQNRSNFAQDSRISIRGFGARANFGIRGIRLIVDGIPLTTPDGQGQVDSLDLASAGRIEVLRGPGASLYGASSGGVIEVTSEEPGESPYVKTRVGVGSYGYRNYQGKAVGQAGQADYLVSISRLELDGYRDHADMENVLLHSRFRYRFDESADLSVVVNHLYAPTADDPGGLTAAQVVADRDAAQPRNVLFDAGESIDNTTLGLVFRKAFNEKHETTASNYYTWRDFDGQIPANSTGFIDLDRFFVGGSLKHVYRDEFFGLESRLTFGGEGEAQLDDRVRHRNEMGVQGALSSDQGEDVTRFGFFAQEELKLPCDFEFTAGARYERVHFGVDDNFLSDGDDSGTVNYNEWSFTGALQWSPTPAANPFVRVSTSFDTPTTTSLGSPNAGGINQDLRAQTAISYELGIKGRIATPLRYEAAVFHIRVDDELVPYVQNFQTFYENAGRSTRTGLELGAIYEPIEGLSASIAYTFSEFEFQDFKSLSGGDFDGREIPGAPKHLVIAELSYAHELGFFGTFRVQFVDERYADNANSAKADSYVYSDVRLGYKHRLGRWELSPFVGVNNLFDNEYTDNLRINDDANRRFFEPAPTINAYGGLSISYLFDAS
jgi:iron complex outermembrane receptor protein